MKKQITMLRIITFIVLACVFFPFLAFANEYLYVTNESGNTVSVIDTATNTVTTTIPVGNGPAGIAANHLGTFVYVTNGEDDTVSVIDTATNTVSDTIVVGNEPHIIAANPAGPFVYVVNNKGNSVSVVNTINNSIAANIFVGNEPWGIAVNTAGIRAYVTNEEDNTVSVINLITNAVTATVPVGNGPLGIAVNPADTFVYVSNEMDKTVSIISTATNVVTDIVTGVGVGPIGIALNSADNDIYAASGGDIVIIDSSSNTIIDTVITGNDSDCVTFNSAGTRAYVTNEFDDSVSVIDTTTNTITDTITVGSGPFWIAVVQSDINVHDTFTVVLTKDTPNLTVTAGTDVRVYGTAVSNEITLERDAKTELNNFPGQNNIQLQSNSDLFTISRSGTYVTFTGSDGTVLKIPATTDIQTISFNGEESRILQIHNNQVLLDDQIITLTPAPIENSANNDLIGSWLYDVDGMEYSAVVTFIDDTNYMFAVDGEPDDGGGKGMERGVYNWDTTSGEMMVSALSQTVGDWGVSDLNVGTLTVVVSNDTLYFDTNDGLVQFSKISAADNPIIGSWLYDAEGLENSAVLTFIDDTNYMFAVDGEPDDGGGKGMERGTYIWDASSGAFSAFVLSNTAGNWGISALATETQSVSISGNMLNFNIATDGLIQFKKIKE